MPIHLKSDFDLTQMRIAGDLTRQVLDMIGPHIQPGVTTLELDQICHSFIVDVLDAIPAPLNYRGFPKSICTSVNHVICHGIPGRLIKKCQECLEKGIATVRPGSRLGDIGAAIQQHAEAAGFSVVREYCGHGIGRGFHEDPQVLHYGTVGQGLEIKPGMTFTIEPMINAGRPETRLLSDGWTVVTKDHSLSAQWEHTLAVTDNGVEILTASKP